MNIKDFRAGNHVEAVRGNFVTNKMENRVLQSIPKAGSAIITPQGLVDLENGLIEVGPVPLTKPLLFNFGFSDEDFKDGYIGIDVTDGLITTQFVLTKPGHMGEFQNFYAWEYTTGSLSFFKKLGYVHELQNLFNILKNQELVFSPSLSLSF